MVAKRRVSLRDLTRPITLFKRLSVHGLTLQTIDGQVRFLSQHARAGGFVFKIPQFSRYRAKGCEKFDGISLRLSVTFDLVALVCASFVFGSAHSMASNLGHTLQRHLEIFRKSGSVI